MCWLKFIKCIKMAKLLVTELRDIPGRGGGGGFFKLWRLVELMLRQESREEDVHLCNLSALVKDMSL